MPHQATNDYVWIIRDKTETEKSGLIVPSNSREKPHTGTIFSAGATVGDPKVKGGKGKKAIFHRGIGQEVEYDGQIYLVMHGHEIIGVD